MAEVSYGRGGKPWPSGTFSGLGCRRPQEGGGEGETTFPEARQEPPGIAREPPPEAAGIEAGRLRVRIAAAPEDGRANRELRAFLAKVLGCAKGEIVLARGEKSRLKTLDLPASSWEALERLIASQR